MTKNIWRDKHVSFICYYIFHPFFQHFYALRSINMLYVYLPHIFSVTFFIGAHLIVWELFYEKCMYGTRAFYDTFSVRPGLFSCLTEKKMKKHAWTLINGYKMSLMWVYYTLGLFACVQFKRLMFISYKNIIIHYNSIIEVTQL